ncbi:hypothetical protein ES708_12801 [subsurface metagenome]
MELADFLGCIAEHLGKSLVRLIHFSVLIEDNYPIYGLVDEDTPPGGFIGQRLLGLFALGDIPGYLKTGNNISIGVSNGAGRILPEDNLPRRHYPLLLYSVRLAVLKGLFYRAALAHLVSICVNAMAFLSQVGTKRCLRRLILINNVVVFILYGEAVF